MTKISESSQWEPEVYLVSRGDRVSGGRDGIANRQAMQLANRTLFLKTMLESGIDYHDATYVITPTDPDGTIAGLQATEDGKVFRVAQGVGTDTSFKYYQNDAGVAVAVALMPSVAVVDKAIDTAAFATQSPANAGIHSSETDDGYLQALADRQGRIFERIDADFIRQFLLPIIVQGMKMGSEKGAAGLFSGQDIRVGFDTAGNIISGNTELSQTDDMLHGVVDALGRCLYRYGLAGQFIQNGIEQFGADITSDDIHKMLTKTGQCLSRYDSRGKFSAVLHEDVIRQITDAIGGVKPEEKPAFQPRLIADLIHAQMYGQSLSAGLGAAFATAMNEMLGVYMPNSGVNDGQTSTQGIENLPLTSSSIAAANPALDPLTRENPVFAMGAQLQNMLTVGGELTNVLVSSAGRGEYRLNQLDKESGSNQYKVLVAQHNQYKQFASALGKSFLTHFLNIIQGESDISAGTTEAEYLRRFLGLITAYQGDIGQDAMPPVMLTYQTASHTKRNPNSTTDVAHAQLAASNISPHIFMVCPSYIFTYNSDGVHMPANSYRHMGSYFGKVANAIIKTGGFKPLQPEQILRTGRVVTVVMHVPVPPMVIDTTLVTNPGNYGFEVFGADGIAKAIESVSVKGDRVVIVLAQDPEQKVTVKYAQGVKGTASGPITGARGNIRDSDSTVAKMIDSKTGNPYSLYNWCPIFSLEENFTWVQ